MALQRLETFEEKLQQMLDRVPDELDKREGSIIYDALAPIALQLWMEESKFREILEQAFAVKAEGYYLDLIAKDHGLERTPANRARVLLEFTGTPGKTVPKGTTVGVLNSDLSYVTDLDCPLSSVTREENGSKVTIGLGRVMATCKLAGDEGNVPVHKITLLFDPNPDVVRVTNPEPGRYGTDEESDASLRNRILYQKRNPEHGGTSSDYVRWALTITGITYAKTLDKPRGIGTVDLIIGGNETHLNELVMQAQTLMDQKKPTGVDVKVRKLKHQRVEIRISVIGLSPSEATSAVLGYTRTIEVGGTLYRSKLVSALVQAGATDATVSEPAINIELEHDSIIDPVVILV
ncbi:baseplate J/gp47 family protein [Brevibacillus dissolubilis]|uniref:baseplate J/gp47 family protein n=1 Tax=Brevibacillus dissolubilis TaxID=1844116 RepID=UPI0011163123|nr:baseplate J/gp47 family protein [Brevibacillus dissolubilis]